MIDAPWIPAEKPLFMVRVCINKRLNTDRLPSCGGRGSRGLADLLERLIMEERLPVQVIRGPCMNNCLHGPNLKVESGDYFSLEGDPSHTAVERIMTSLRAETVRRRSVVTEPPS